MVAFGERYRFAMRIKTITYSDGVGQKPCQFYWRELLYIAIDKHLASEQRKSGCHNRPSGVRQLLMQMGLIPCLLSFALCLFLLVLLHKRQT
jgi:hypothetical protein